MTVSYLAILATLDRCLAARVLNRTGG